MRTAKGIVSRHVHASLCLLLLACGGDSNSEMMLYGSASDAPIVEARVQHALVLVDSVGSIDGDLAFGRIVSAALLPDGTIVVADDQQCAVGVIRQRSEVEWRGGCGSGPGEYRSIGPITMMGDTIVVMDHQLQRLTFVSASTGEGRTLDLDPGGAGAAMIWQIGMLNDTTVLASIAPMAPDAWQSNDMPADGRYLLALFDVRTGLVRGQLLPDPPLAMAETPRLIRALPMCHNPFSGLTAVLNDWTFQGVVLDAESDSVVVNFHSPVSWYHPYRDKNGALIPPGARIGIACGDSVFLFKANQLQRDADGPARSVATYLEARSPDGARLLHQQVDDDRSPLLGSLLAGQGHTFVFYRSGADGVPRLWIYELVARPSMSEN
ncbi:MAG: hypothetical protein ACYC28_12950 [Longimicrobiales bacterium]